MNKERTRYKKGISLIVLVITIIVIIILAVAVILSIANNNPIENAKEARFKNDIKTIEEDLNMYTLKKYADREIKGIEEVNLSEDKMVSALPSSKNYKDKVEVKNGTLYIKSGEALTQEEQKWAKEVGIEEVPETSITFEKKGTEKLKIGSEVEASNGEQFYVIGEGTVGTTISDSTSSDILLLAKYNLKEENGTLKQDKKGGQNPCAFSSTNYWSSETNYPVNLNNYKLNDAEVQAKIKSTDAIEIAKRYGITLGSTGRLMTYEETMKLTDTSILFGSYSTGSYLKYWLGSAIYEGVDGELSCIDGEVAAWANSLFSKDTIWGVRPVVIVSRSSIN